VLMASGGTAPTLVGDTDTISCDEPPPELLRIGTGEAGVEAGVTLGEAVGGVCFPYLGHQRKAPVQR
jgi:hypothetical protein